MALDKQTSFQLDRFANAFKEARERGANESDTVMYLIKFFEEALGYDSLKGEISKELAIKDRYCDVALRVGGEVKLLVEVKAASLKGLADKHIEQAENYASRAGLRWVLLTNGIEWRLYHLAFSEGEGIVHDLAFHANLLEESQGDREALWQKLSLLSRAAMKNDEVEDYWAQRKVLSPASVVKVLFHEDVLAVIRRELNRAAPARLDMEDVFKAVRDAISKEALAEAGDLGIKKRRRRRKKIQRTDTAGQTVTEEVEVEEEDDGVTELASATVEVPAPDSNGPERSTPPG